MVIAKNRIRARPQSHVSSSVFVTGNPNIENIRSGATLIFGNLQSTRFLLEYRTLLDLIVIDGVFSPVYSI
jgi:hypothetical protein